MSSELIGNRRRFDVLPGGGYAYHCIDEPLTIEVRYLRREHGQLVAEVDVRCEWPGTTHHCGSISCADLNLSSQTARKTLAKHCAERTHTKPDEFDWIGVIDAACLSVIQAERQGDDVIVLDDAPVIAERDFSLHGLQVPADSTSLLIAHGDSMKSMVLLLMLGTLAQQGRRVLLIDWEWTAARHLGRKRRLFGSERLDSLRYLKCRAPLTIERDRIRRYCDAERIEFVGIDSVGLACDGKLIDDDVAIRFHRALGSLPPSLCAAHVPKSSINVDAKAEPTAFGSVYFTNLCRASWIVRKQPGATDDVVTVGLYRQKQNDGERSRPVGLEFTFTQDRISVRPVDLASVEGLAERLPLSQRMAHLLARGPMTLAANRRGVGCQGGQRDEGRHPRPAIHQGVRQRRDHPDRARFEASGMSRRPILPLPSATGRTGQDNTLKGVLSVQQSAQDMSSSVLDNVSSPIEKVSSPRRGDRSTVTSARLQVRNPITGIWMLSRHRYGAQKVSFDGSVDHRVSKRTCN